MEKGNSRWTEAADIARKQKKERKKKNSKLRRSQSSSAYYYGGSGEKVSERGDPPANLKNRTWQKSRDTKREIRHKGNSRPHNKGRDPNLKTKTGRTSQQPTKNGVKKEFVNIGNLACRNKII